ncbi:MAG: electron transfer flavoprotein subunit alpha/FixB family protein [Candidatus Heimdallarchaeota archaeon]|nr:electron transfer flavoprotein subunit alpha/FixB family protein [Candidatus Heimdallarchaeota archaeon]
MNSKEIWVFIEISDTGVEPVSWELLGKARELANKVNFLVTSIIISNKESKIAEEAIARGSDKVLYIIHNECSHYSFELFTKIITDLNEKFKPEILLMPATHNSRDLAGRLAIRLHTGLTADVVQLDINNQGILLGAVPGFGGSILAIIKCEQSIPQMATVRPGIFQSILPDQNRKGTIEYIFPQIKENLKETILIKKITLNKEDISKSPRLVIAGRGISSNLNEIRLLAELINGGVGVTRPISDMGLFGREHQIGSTGISVKSKLAIIFGASGATHFSSGIKNVETVISINLDHKALINEVSDYFIIADASEILPRIIDKLKLKMELIK